MARANRGKNKDDESKGSGSGLRTLLVVGLVSITVALILRVYMAPRDIPSVVAETAAKATGEIAELLWEAERAVIDFCRQYPDTVESLDILALLHSHFGQVEDAVELWEECAQRDPTFVNAHYRLGLINRDQGENAQATQRFRQALRLEPDSSYLLVHLAKSLLTEGKLEDAVTVLEAERRIRPSSVSVLVVLGDAYLQLKQYEPARDAYDRAVQLAPELATARFGLGTSCMQLGEKEKAKRHLTQFQQLKDRDEQAHRDQLKDTQLGLHEVQSSVVEIGVVVAKAYIANGDPLTAETLLQRAAQIEPGSAEAPRILAWLYEREDRVDEAVQTLTELAVAVPEDFSVHLSLAHLLSRIGQTDQAEKSFLRSAELTPSEAGAYSTLAEFYLGAANKPREARVAAQKAVELAPTADHYRLLAMACYDSGQKQLALIAIERAVALAPGQEEYRAVRDTIRSGLAAE